jgi:hypothetical protein
MRGLRRELANPGSTGPEVSRPAGRLLPDQVQGRDQDPDEENLNS